MFRRAIHRIVVAGVGPLLAAGLLATSAGAAQAQIVQPHHTGNPRVHVLSSPCQPGVQYCVDTGNGTPLNLRPCPNTGPPTGCGRPSTIPNPIRRVPDGEGVFIICQVPDGQGLQGLWGYTTIWDLVYDTPSNSDGYLFDGFVWTGSNGQVLSTC